jgi:lysozyme
MAATTRQKVVGGGAAAIGIAAAFITAWEGTRTHAYADSVGIATLCTGHTYEVHMGDTATREQCQQWLRGDLGIALNAVENCVHPPIPLTDNQLAALASATFNIGPKVVCGSTLQRMANGGAPAAQWCPKLLNWVYAGGRRLQGLVNRRAAEVKLCLKPDTP